MQSRAEAVVDQQSPLLYSVRERIGALALQYRIPTFFNHRLYAVAGALIGRGAETLAIQRRAAWYVDRILRGTKPGDLPLEQPTTFNMAVNVKTLHALGLTIPPSVLPLVTEWIQ